MSNVTNDPVVIAAVAAAGFASDTEANTTPTEQTQPDEPTIEEVVEEKSASLFAPWMAFAVIGAIAVIAFLIFH